MVLDGLSPEGVDTIALKGKTHQIIEFKYRTNETAYGIHMFFPAYPLIISYGLKIFL